LLSRIRARFFEPVEAERAFDARPRRMQVENLTLRACRELNTRRAGSPLGFVCGKSGTRIVRGPAPIRGQGHIHLR
jgi:hypothetical protein